MTVKSLRKQLAAAIAMTLVATVALGSSTYAWFVNNASVTATNVSVTASTAYSLLIASDEAPTTWGTTTALDPTAVNLIPASTVGTKQAADDTAATPKFKKDDLRFATDTTWNGNYVVGYKEVYSTDSVTTEKVDGTSVTSKYFYKDTVYLKSAQAAKIYLDSNGTGIGTTDTSGVLTSTKKFNDNDLTAQQKAMLNTMRVAFVVSSKTDTSNTTGGIYVYQLVADGTTASLHYSTTTDASGANGITAGIDAALTPIAPATFANFKTNTVPVITDKMATGSTAGFATTTNAEALITVAANEEVKVDIYVWMEGCDYDVNATNLVNFQEAAINDMMFGFCIGTAN